VSELPRFAVVGRVNKGKSSVVSTLAEDDAVRVDPRPGTTTEVREYPVQVDGRTAFVLLDTPGFEDAPRALAWLRAGNPSAAERPARVAALLAAHAGTGVLEQECRLLAPIVAGAGVLYVVDGTKPFRPNYEAEMEILRWTGQPGMALVNRIGAGDHGAEWRRALEQYFGIVRDLDAFRATFQDRLALLAAFRELRPEWRPALDGAIAALAARRRRQRTEAAAEIADLLADALTHVEEVTVEEGEALDPERERLEGRFHDALRAREARARARVEALYGHARARFLDASLERPRLEQDLFAEETWQVLGLSPGQLVAAGTLAGATAGGAIDAAVGGASLLAGTVLGGALGGGAALDGVGRCFARARPAGPAGVPGLLLDARRFLGGGRTFRVGPHAQPNFPWVLLDRALLHFEAVERHAHARRGEVALGGADARGGRAGHLARAQRRELEDLFRALRRSAPVPPRRVRDALERVVEGILREVDPVPGD
jgi:hypothetical protein